MSDTIDASWPQKAYKNLDFLNSNEARAIRVLCELEEPEKRLREQNVQDTIVMFGSARTRPLSVARKELQTLESALEGRKKLSAKDKEALALAKANLRNAPFYDHAMALSRELTKWSMSLKDKRRRFLVCSGGGPGIMEAANRGAKKAGGASVGLGISLPFEQSLNKYVTRDLGFEFHYFFVRKYWFIYMAKALVVFPGGFGTMDELFETLTLIQTHKVNKRLPIVLFGGEFWNNLINFDTFVEWGVISPKDVGLFRVIDSVEEARDYIIGELTEAHLS
jgi:uncharacterized protein (TIGR00730 family)